MKTEAVHELTVNEIDRLTGEFSRQRRSYTEELAALFAAAGAGQPEEQPATQRAEAVRGRALEMLNGYAPAGLKRPAIVSRKAELEIEVEAVDRVLEVLSTKELIARAAEAAEFALVHGDEWREICRDILLCAARLGALEARAVAWRQSIGGGVTPSSLPLAQHIGTGRSVLGVAWGADPLSRARTAALEAKIVTPKELKAAADA